MFIWSYLIMKKSAILRTCLKSIGVLCLAHLIAFSTQTLALEQLPLAMPESVGVSSQRLQRLDESMRRYIDNELLAGTVTLIARDGKIIHLKAQGWKDKEKDLAMTDDTIFVIMSMTKPIVSVALMMLYEEGRFLLTDPVSRWIPEIIDKKVIIQTDGKTIREETASPITFRDVLAHTAGVNPPRDALNTEEINLLDRKDTLEETILARAPLPLAFHPGEEWQYGSSTDYVALLVERIADQPLPDFLEQRIFNPLRMEDTHYVVPREKVRRVASVYSPSGPDKKIELFRAPAYRETKYFGGTAGLSSTAADYFRFSQMLLNGGELDGVRLLSPKTINLMITNHTGDNDIYIRGPGYTFGLGFGILNDAGKARDPFTPSTFTWGGAWGTIFFVDPIENMIGIMLTQITSYRHINARQDLGVTAMQSIINSYSNQPLSISPYQKIDP
ncbi:MAG: serine hydrolase [Deltaproteobacteria bacterium]|nr:serine hydrolase [Deltaproteobacteria bacterium]